MLPYKMQSHLFNHLIKRFSWQKLILNLLFASYQYYLRTGHCWVSDGEGYITWTRFCRWDVVVHAQYLKHSVQHFSGFSETKPHVTAMVHFLDDFLLLATSKRNCAADLAAFESLCRQIGVPLAAEKTILPTTTLRFLGITLDTIALEARLPPDKLH